MTANPTRANSYDGLRLLAAAAVVVNHQFLVLGLPEPRIFDAASLGFFAVLVFFGMSGGLITESWEREPSAKHFLRKRCRRIFPALAVLMMLTVLIVGPVFSTRGVAAYFSDWHSWLYLRAVFLWPFHSWLPGVFEANPFPRAVNASLWTLSLEFALYLSVLGAGVMGWLRRRHALPLICVALALLAAAASFHRSSMVADVGLLLFMFWWGAWLREHLQAPPSAAPARFLPGLFALALFAATAAHGLPRAGLVVLASLLIWAAAKVPWGARLTDRTGDFSYGVYIYAFPVQQAFVAAWGMKPFAAQLLASGGITFALAFCSWHFVEKHFIRRKISRPTT